MPGKPFQSSLIPYRTEIFRLRSCNPPDSYARIAELLRENYGIDIKRGAIVKFVKARSGGRKVHFFRKDLAAKKMPSCPAAGCSESFRRRYYPATTVGAQIRIHIQRTVQPHTVATGRGGGKAKEIGGAGALMDLAYPRKEKDCEVLECRYSG